ELAPDDRLPALTGEVCRRLAAVAGGGALADLAARPLIQLGVDSLRAIELRNGLERDFETSLPLSALLQRQTSAPDVARVLLDQLTGSAAGGLPVVVADAGGR